MAQEGDGFECTDCSDPERRELLGCDAPTKEPVRHLEPCPFHRGDGAGCEDCGGTNRVPLHRCPRSHVTQRELDVVAAVSLVQYGVLPSRGGWMDQPHTFVRAFALVAAEVANWHAVLHERASKEAQRKAGKKR